MAETVQKSRVHDDIVYEILLWLPVRTLKRFQSASKSWFSLISSPQFQKQHFRRAQENPPLLLTLEKYNPASPYTLRFASYKNKEGNLTLFKILYKRVQWGNFVYPCTQSCLGLVCIYQWNFYRLPILICNPATEELIFLLPSRKYIGCVGFGYAASTEEYKVVRLFYEEKKKRSFCQIFTLGTRFWREVSSLPYCVNESPAPFLHGALHFLPQLSYYSREDPDYIAALDIDNEEYREAIPLPAYDHSLWDSVGRYTTNPRNPIQLTKLRGSLYLFFNFCNPKHFTELWLLKDYYSAEWVKEYTIDLSTVYPYQSPIRTYPVESMGNEILFNCDYGCEVKLLSYDPQNGIVKVKKEKEWAATFYMENFYQLGS